MNDWEGEYTSGGGLHKPVNPLPKKKHTLNAQLSVFGVVVLAVGLFAAVLSVQQNQDTRSRASVVYQQITLVGNYSNKAAASSFSLNKPAGVAANDVIVAQIVVGNSSTTAITPPAGWTLIRRDNNTDESDFSSALYYRVAGASEPATYVWKLSAAKYVGGGLSAYRNVDTGSPIDVHSGKNNVNTRSVTAPSVTVTTPKDQLLFFGATGNSAGTMTTPSGMTKRWAVSHSYLNSHLSDQALIASGDTGVRTGTSSLSTGYSNIGQLVALKPIGIAPTATTIPTVEPTIEVPTIAPTVAPTVEPTVVWTVTPTDFPTPTPTIVVPTSTPIPTATPNPTSTSLSLTIALNGIGSSGNASPLHPQRTATVDVYNAQNELEVTKQGVVTYQDSSGKYVGTVDLGAGAVTGTYSVKVKVDQYLRNLVPGIHTITQNQNTVLPEVSLIAGDVNGDNVVNIIDYSILMGCYSDLLPAADCSGNNDVLADLTDDGHVNQFDYNFFLRELSSKSGQ